MIDGFVLGATIFVPQFHSKSYLFVLTLYYFAVLYGTHLYAGRLAIIGFNKWSGKDIHEEESLVEKLERLWKRLNALVDGNTR